MGILSTPSTEKKTPASARRKSTGLDFTSLKPLTSTGTKNFAGYRDSSTTTPPFNKVKASKRKDDDAMDSDADDEDSKISEEVDDSDVKSDSKGMLSPEDALRQGELAEGVRKIKVLSLFHFQILHPLLQVHLPPPFIPRSSILIPYLLTPIPIPYPLTDKQLTSPPAKTPTLRRTPQRALPRRTQIPRLKQPHLRYPSPHQCSSPQ